MQATSGEIKIGGEMVVEVLILYLYFGSRYSRIVQYPLQRQILLHFPANCILMTHTILSKSNTGFLIGRLKPASQSSYREGTKNPPSLKHTIGNDRKVVS